MSTMWQNRRKIRKNSVKKTFLKNVYKKSKVLILLIWTKNYSLVIWLKRCTQIISLKWTFLIICHCVYRALAFHNWRTFSERRPLLLRRFSANTYYRNLVIDREPLLNRSPCEEIGIFVYCSLFHDGIITWTIHATFIN